MVSSSLVSNACKSGVGLPSSPRIAQQSRKRRLTPDQACLYLVAVDFFIAPDGSLPYAGLAETDGKLIPACSPAEVQEAKSPGAELEAAEASNGSPANYCFSMSPFN